MPAKAGASATVSDPQNPERVYAVGPTGVFRSDDGGINWQSASQGIEPAAAQAIALDPQQPQQLYVETTSGVLYVSHDGAGSWQPSTGGH